MPLFLPPLLPLPAPSTPDSAPSTPDSAPFIPVPPPPLSTPSVQCVFINFEGCALEEHHNWEIRSLGHNEVLCAIIIAV